MNATNAPSRRYSLKGDLQLGTMTIVVAVLLGIIEAAIEIVGALGYLERTVWAAGPIGFAFQGWYNGATWVLYFSGAYLRKQSGVILLAAVVTALVRWFFGDPDGPLLLVYAVFPSVFILATFAAMRWRGGNLLFALAGAAAGASNAAATFIGQGGFQLAGGAGWAFLSIVIGGIGGLLWGVLARYLGKALERAGVPSVDEPPARGGGAEAYA